MKHTVDYTTTIPMLMEKVEMNHLEVLNMVYNFYLVNDCNITNLYQKLCFYSKYVKSFQIDNIKITISKAEIVFEELQKELDISFEQLSTALIMLEYAARVKRNIRPFAMEEFDKGWDEYYVYEYEHVGKQEEVREKMHARNEYFLDKEKAFNDFMIDQIMKTKAKMQQPKLEVVDGQ